MVGATFSPSSSGGPTQTVTQCYGNCGSPALTLANTNSTHSTAFNQTITDFYQFQANVNGFILNATVNAANSYTNGQVIAVSVYIITSCPVGQTPFSTGCPGLLQFSNRIQNPAKGQVSAVASSGQFPVSNGQWVGVGFTCLFSPCDLNDTNTTVNPLLQTSGFIPVSITQSSNTGCACKTGAWIFIRGNVVTGGGPVTPGVSACPGIIDCILPQLAQSLCFNPTATCVNAGGLVELVGLSIAALFFVVRTASSSFPNVKLPLGELLLFFGIIFAFILTGANVLFVWVPVLIFFLVSLFMQKQTSRFL